jgi:8-oxo-dGTP diphosphatase
MNIAVCVLIVDKKTNHFLAVSLKNDHTDFNMPGGKLENNETYEETAIREVKEETGLHVFNLKKLYIDYDYDIEVHTYFTYDYNGELFTKENHILKWLPLYDLTKSKKWINYNSMIFNKYLELKI